MAPPTAKAAPRYSKTFTPLELAKLAKNAGFTGVNVVNAVAKALAESGGVLDAVGGPNTNGTYDYGLWQINSVHGYDKNRLLGDPQYNANCAYEIWKRQGWGAWYADPTEDQRKAAAKAAKELGELKPGEDLGGNWATDLDSATSSIVDSVLGWLGPGIARAGLIAGGAILIGVMLLAFLWPVIKSSAEAVT